jgi:hypothetical protein
MFADYFLEEYNKHTVETERGFVMYVANEKDSEFFVNDLYVKPEFRNTIEIRRLFNACKVKARELGLKHMTGVVSFGVKSPERSTRILKCYLAHGFKVISAKNEQIILHMEV